MFWSNFFLLAASITSLFKNPIEEGLLLINLDSLYFSLLIKKFDYVRILSTSFLLKFFNSVTISINHYYGYMQILRFFESGLWTATEKSS